MLDEVEKNLDGVDRPTPEAAGRTLDRLVERLATLQKANEEIEARLRRLGQV